MAIRTGLQAATKLCEKFCKLLAVYKPSIQTAINASSLSTENKAAAIATLNSIESSCDLFRQLMVTWES